MALDFFVVLLTLVFYICICSGEGPTAGPVGEGSECTSGFITLDRLKLLAPVSVARQNQQIIIPGINFTCDGAITKWVVGARWEGNDWYPDLQLWREAGNGAYTKVGNTTLRVDIENTSGVYEYPVNPPLEFQAGDILGIFQPLRENSSIRINYETGNGPPNYFMFAGGAVEPQLEGFAIEHDTQINYDTPLVAVEISAQEGVLQCTRGFMSQERINILRPVMTRNRQQRIFPQINFICDGNITKWIMGANQDDSQVYYPELQIWRNNGDSTYMKVGNTPPAPFVQDVTTNVYEYTPDSPLEFKSGDILGVFQPRFSLSRLRVYYDVNNGPTSFDVPVGVEDTEPLQDTFILTQSVVRTSSDLPLVTVEIAVSTSQESSLFIISTTTEQSPTITALGTSIHSSPPGSVHITSTQSRRELTVLPPSISSPVLKPETPSPVTQSSLTVTKPSTSSSAPSTSDLPMENTATPSPSSKEKPPTMSPSFTPEEFAPGASSSSVAAIAGASIGALVGIGLGIGVVVLIAVGLLKKQKKYTLPSDQQHSFNNPVYDTGGFIQNDTASIRYASPADITTTKGEYMSVAGEHAVSPDTDLAPTQHEFDNPLYGDVEPMVMYSTGLYESVTDSKSSAHMEWGVYVPTEEQRKTFSEASLQEHDNGSIYCSLKHESSQQGDQQTFFEESEIYWVPSSNSAELYAQMAKFRYREIFRHQISIAERLGSGVFGTVDKGVWVSPRGTIEVAVKMLKKEASEKDRVKFLQEAAIMGQFLHPNVVKLHGVVTIEEPMMIVLELMPKGDLRNFLSQIKPCPGEMVHEDMPKLCLQFCHQIASGMAHLSGKSFVHRDLAARNVLVSKDNICKIADFGMARDLEDENYYVSHGGKIPVKWTAPEALNFKKYSTASDVWSYGAVMYEIWSLGHKPFEGYSNPQVVRLIDEGYRLPPSPGCPKAIYSLMIQCWHPETSSRLTFTDILQSLSQSETDLLRWSEEDTRVHPQAAVLGAPLEAGKNLYPDLQGTYM